MQSFPKHCKSSIRKSKDITCWARLLHHTNQNGVSFDIFSFIPPMENLDFVVTSEEEKCMFPDKVHSQKLEEFDSLISNGLQAEKNEILLAAINGNKRCIVKVLEQYTPLVHKIVNKYSFCVGPANREDLVQEGMVGVHKAIETFDVDHGTSFMTWVFHKVRGQVQNFARKEQRRSPQNLVKIADIEHLQSHWDLSSELYRETIAKPDAAESAAMIRKLLTDTCGSLESKRAQIICNRFGLLGTDALRQGEVAAKFNMTKQAVNSHISQFSKKVREKYPDLYENVLRG